MFVLPPWFYSFAEREREREKERACSFPRVGRSVDFFIFHASFINQVNVRWGWEAGKGDWEAGG